MYLPFLLYLTGTVHIDNISENMPELARKANFHLLSFGQAKVGNTNIMNKSNGNTINNKSSENMPIQTGLHCIETRNTGLKTYKVNNSIISHTTNSSTRSTNCTR